MIELGVHANLIIGTYAGVTFVIGALIIFTAMNARKQRTRLNELEAQGIRRRSDQPNDTTTTNTGTSNE